MKVHLICLVILRIFPMHSSVNTQENFKSKDAVKGLTVGDIEKNFTAKDHSNESERLQIPATYIIDNSAKVSWRHFDPGYKNRASAKKIAEALDQHELYKSTIQHEKSIKILFVQCCFLLGHHLRSGPKSHLAQKRIEP